MMATYRSMAFMIGFVTLWAVIEWVAGGILTQYSAYQVVWTRYLVHLVCMLVIVAPRTPRRGGEGQRLTT